MLKLLKANLDADRVFEGQLPDILRQIVDAIPNNTINYRMKLTIAASELILFASQLRRNIAHWNGSMIPINAITFSISASGSGKDSSVNAARKCFKSGYDIIEEKRKSIATQNAIKLAMMAGRDSPEEWSTYREYYVAPNPLFVAPSTSEGFIQHLNDLDAAGIGSGFIYSGEIGAEMANSSTIIDNIKVLAEIYDEGSKEVKVLKNRDNQSKEIKNLPVSALFVGSQDNILYDDSTKKVFRREFSTKLARRSFFNFNPTHVEPVDYSKYPDPVGEMIRAETLIETKAVEARTKVQAIVKSLAMESVKGVGKPLPVDEATRVLFLKYKRYNEELADTIKHQYPISKLVRSHLQWKSLKLAGAIAIFNGHSSITIEDFISAISYAEMLDKDMTLFETELVKEPYELFVDFMHHNAVEGKATLGLHTLRKLGYIPTSGVPTNKMKELVHLATSYDTTGIYTVCEEGICYEEIIKTDVAGISFMAVSGSKADRQTQCASGYEFYETDFNDLSEMLKEDFAYSPFRFKDGIRGKEHIIGGCKWICLDIDDSTITDEECHFILQDINHHIARTSDASNPFKFRVLLELDAIVDIPDLQWKHFIKSISEFLSLKADPLPKSQIFFSYQGRDVLSITGKSPIEVKEHLLYAMSNESKASAPKPTTAQAKALLSDKLTTFARAFDCVENGSLELITAAKYARDLGLPKEEIIALMYEINNYWSDPMDETRLQNTIVSQISRW